MRASPKPFRIVRDTVDFFRRAPRIEGIPPDQQVQSLRQLMALKIRKLVGKPLSFNEEKRLELSDIGGFQNNEGIIKIDDEVKDLSVVINSKEYLYTMGSCSGHLEEQDGELDFKDTGFISFEFDKNHPRSQSFLDTLRAFCETETAADPDCSYLFESFDVGSWAMISWRWNHPAYEAKKVWESTKGSYLSEVDFEAEDYKRQKALMQFAPLAKEQKIHERHIAFVGRLSDFIRNFN